MYKHTVQYYETDKMGITHHSNYIRFMEEARVDFMAEIGWDYATMEKNGIFSPVIGIECKFKKPSTFSDEIFIDLKIIEYKDIRIKFSYEMFDKDGALIFTGTSEHCFINGEGKIVIPRKINPALDEKLKEFALQNS